MVAMPPSLRERKKQQQRQAIVEAAIALFREHGFDETRVQDILDRTNISLGTFYNYFPGKDAVLDEFGNGLIASYVELARSELDAAGLSVAERVHALARACGRAFSSDPAFMTVVVTRSRAFGGRGELPAHDVPIYGLLASLFEHGQSTGEVRRDVPAVELAEIFSGVFMFAVVSWLATGQAGQQHIEDAEAQLDGRLIRAFDVFLDGCRSPAG
jgi:AcrR family transcriptional regulator